MSDSLPYEEIDLSQYDVEGLLKEAIGSLNSGQPLSYEERLIVREILMKLWKERKVSLPKKKGRKPGRIRKDVLSIAYKMLVDVVENKMTVQDALLKYSATPARDSTLENAYYDLRQFYETGFDGDLKKLELIVKLSTSYS